MLLQQLHVIFQAMRILNRITYAIPVWGPFVNTNFWQKIRASRRGLGVMVALQALL